MFSTSRPVRILMLAFIAGWVSAANAVDWVITSPTNNQVFMTPQGPIDSNGDGPESSTAAYDQYQRDTTTSTWELWGFSHRDIGNGAVTISEVATDTEGHWETKLYPKNYNPPGTTPNYEVGRYKVEMLNVPGMDPVRFFDVQNDEM